jgi:F0F1-type ATP synthase assembly protein I
VKRLRGLRQARQWVDVSIVGIQFPISIAIGFFFGRWLDRHLGTDPWLMLVFSLFGIAAGFLNLFRIVAKATEDEKKEAEELARQQKNQPDGDGG